MTYIRAWMSLKFGQIRPQTTELAALKHLKNLCFHFFSLCIMALRSALLPFGLLVGMYEYAHNNKYMFFRACISESRSDYMEPYRLGES